MNFHLRFFAFGLNSREQTFKVLLRVCGEPGGGIMSLPNPRVLFVKALFVFFFCPKTSLKNIDCLGKAENLPWRLNIPNSSNSKC